MTCITITTVLYLHNGYQWHNASVSETWRLQCIINWITGYIQDEIKCIKIPFILSTDLYCMIKFTFEKKSYNLINNKTSYGNVKQFIYKITRLQDAGSKLSRNICSALLKVYVICEDVIQFSVSFQNTLIIIVLLLLRVTKSAIPNSLIIYIIFIDIVSRVRILWQ